MCTCNHLKTSIMLMCVSGSRLHTGLERQQLLKKQSAAVKTAGLLTLSAAAEGADTCSDPGMRRTLCSKPRGCVGCITHL
jgi:hypothetical protein